MSGNRAARSVCRSESRHLHCPRKQIFPTTRPDFDMQKVFITVAGSLALNLPNSTLGQSTEPSVYPGDVIELRVRIGGAVRNPGFFDVDPTVTVSGALAMAGGPTPQGQRDKVWVFRDGEIITTILGGATLIADSPIRSGDQLFVAWVSGVSERRWISRNGNVFSAALGGAVGIAIALIR